jgi:hypothetical protein
MIIALLALALQLELAPPPSEPQPAAALEFSVPQVDDLRALLYRIDQEARVSELHPEWSWSRGQAAHRFARDAGALFDKAPGMQEEGDALERAAKELADAGRRQDPEDVRAAARAVQAEVRRLEDALPPAGRLK